MSMWEAVLSSGLRRMIHRGELVVRHPHGRTERYGERGAPMAATVQLHDRLVARQLVLNPRLGLGEAYVDGRLTIEGDDLYGLVDLLLANLANARDHWVRRWLGSSRATFRRVARANTPARARRNAAYHYDLSDALYELFLEPDRQYSCAFFGNPGDSLEAAQEAKKDRIAAKLLLEPGHRVLDIGCGWGGLALHLARTRDVRVTGITLSQEQHRAAVNRATRAPLAATPTFLLEDYRRVTGMFDRIVSVGMFEHVEVPHYREFFNRVRDRLADDGVALIHTIGRASGPAVTDPWIDRYVFPGATIPALSEIMPSIERASLILADLEVWRLHYAMTLRAWRRRFEPSRDRVRELYDERFCRLWSYYLVTSELSFRRAGLVVFQLQLSKRTDAVPVTRDYLISQTAQAVPMARSA